MSTDYRALCVEILQKLDQYEDGQRVDWEAWRNNARAALAQPEADEDCLVTKGLVDMFHYWDYQRYCKEND
jgi:hypothetical protein